MKLATHSEKAVKWVSMSIFRIPNGETIIVCIEKGFSKLSFGDRAICVMLHIANHLRNHFQPLH